ncbi:MAG: DUF1361 domain-containing protein [Acidimicrobiia bacterium]
MNQEALGTLWRWVDPRLDRSGDGGVVVGAVVAGLLVDLAVRSGGGLSAAILVVAVAATFIVVVRPAGWQAGGLVGAAAVFAAFLAVRSSPWLVPLDVLVIGGVLVLGASLARGGSILDLPISGLLARAVHAVVHGVAAPAFAVRGLPWMRSRSGAEQRTWPAVLRGLLVLALVPWMLSLYLFRSTRRPGAAWVCGALTCLLLVPNAPYVLTDVIHLPPSIRREPSDAAVLLVVFPVYAALFAIGFGTYCDALRRFTRYMTARAGPAAPGLSNCRCMPSRRSRSTSAVSTVSTAGISSRNLWAFSRMPSPA